MDQEQIRLNLISKRGSWRAIGAKAQVSQSWLSKFANHHIVSPRLITLQRLQAAMDERPEQAAA